MKNAFVKKSARLLAVVMCLCLAYGTVTAQGGDETEPANNSQLLDAPLPADALRVLPQSVPGEVNQTLDKVVAAGNGKVERGDTEVIVWAGANYKKSNSPQIVRQLRDKWQAAGWAFELGGEAEGATLFSLVKDGRQKRAVIGFYGSTDDAFILALTELVQPGKSNVKAASQSEEPSNVEEPERKAATKSNATPGDLVGKWEKKTSGMSSFDANTRAYLGSSGNYESYTFYADGRVDYASLISVQNYGCNLSAFSQGKGRASVSGSAMNISLGAGTIDRKDTCSPSKDYKKATGATSFNYAWTVGKDDYGVVQLCLTQENGEKYCYRRAQ